MALIFVSAKGENSIAVADGANKRLGSKHVPSAVMASAGIVLTGVGTVILTLGARGAYVASREVRALVPAFPVKPVDTTAAGDVFNGALAVALLEGRALLKRCGLRMPQALCR